MTLFYRRERQDMPAQETEIAAAEAEGVRIEYRVGPVRILTQDGKVSGLELVRMEMGDPDGSGRRTPKPMPGSEFQVDVDTVISAISQIPDLDFLTKGSGVEVTLRPSELDHELKTQNSKIWAGGDVVTGPSTVLASMAQGRIAAGKIIEYLTGEPSPLAELPLPRSWRGRIHGRSQRTSPNSHGRKWPSGRPRCDGATSRKWIWG